ncbi:hypothetical protein [Noviherbaspirillum aerium]|uniref:hypothetical protein n=1 Tax=Noviherbaspirillum aerium TaxID=2588497 RepID=UPI00124DD044|nr:hypothetical protein [Noviherbaspirillum aerium]
MLRFTKALYLSTLWIVLSMSCALLWMTYPELWSRVPLHSWSWAETMFSPADPDDIAEVQLAISFVICASVMATGFFTVALIRLKCRQTLARLPSMHRVTGTLQSSGSFDSRRR